MEGISNGVSEGARTPLKVYCKKCGAPAGFDIINQTYRCSYCGMLSGIEEAKNDVYNWRALKKQEITAQSAGLNIEENRCNSCGATIVFKSGEASEKCAFCGTKLVRKELSDASQMPELIIPFFITPDEARERMLKWGRDHEKTEEGRSIVSGMGNFCGYYLPYKIVRGPVKADITRDGTARRYECFGFLEGVAVNTSKQLDNLVLNEMEPFDWSAARPFEYGYLAGIPVKLSDLSESDADKRIAEETAEGFKPDVEKVMQTSGVNLNVLTGNLSVINALLPVYFIRSGKLTAVVNGQTGRIAVSKERKNKSYPWVIEPLIYTIILTCLMGVWMHWNPEGVFYSACVFGCIIFAIMADGRGSLIKNIVMKSDGAKAHREEGVLKIDEGKNILKNPFDNTPIFYEFNERRMKVPVLISFYSFVRVLSALIRALVFVFAPVIIAAPMRLIDMNAGETFMEGFHPLYGAAWYTLTAFFVLVYFVKGLRKDVYDHPILREINPDGSTRLMGRFKDRRLTMLALIGVGSIDKTGKRITFFDIIKSMGGAGIFFVGGIFVIFLGSTLAIFL